MHIYVFMYIFGYQSMCVYVYVMFIHMCIVNICM